MSGLVILAAVLAVLLLLGQVRIGLQGEYTASGPAAWARLGPISLKLWPRKKKKRKEVQRKTQKPAQSSQKSTPAAGGSLDYARELVPLALEAAGQFRQKLRIDRLELVVKAGARDPADAAMVYGCANAALGALWLPLTNSFHVKDGTARAELDFQSDGTTVYAVGAMSLKVGQALRLGLYFGLKGISKLSAVKGRRNTKDKERKAV